MENILRSDLTAVEEAEAMDRLMKKHSFSQDDLAKKFSKTISSISKTLSINKLPPEVLDDCRKDPAIPKRVLIDIAQKKQARSMATANQKYKAGLNPQKKTATGARLSVVQNICTGIDSMGQKISGLDVTGLTHDERDSFANTLDNLKQIIESKFQAMAQ